MLIVFSNKDRSQEYSVTWHETLKITLDKLFEIVPNFHYHIDNPIKIKVWNYPCQPFLSKEEKTFSPVSLYCTRQLNLPVVQRKVSLNHQLNKLWANDVPINKLFVGWNNLFLMKTHSFELSFGNWLPRKILSIGTCSLLILNFIWTYCIFLSYVRASIATVLGHLIHFNMVSLNLSGRQFC